MNKDNESPVKSITNIEYICIDKLIPHPEAINLYDYKVTAKAEILYTKEFTLPPYPNSADSWTR